MTGKELRELNWLYDLAYNVVNDANKEYTDEAYQTVKQALELLAKYKRAFEILKEFNDLPPLEEFVYCKEENYYYK